MSDLLFVQMSGAPGSGKSTLARALSLRVNAVVIDHDITKSALLEAQVPTALAGPASYQVLKSLASSLLDQRKSVIFDSPCFYEDLLQFGQNLARFKGAKYRYIECVVADMAELDRRLRNRDRLPSQVVGIKQNAAEFGRTVLNESVFRDWVANMKRPTTPYLQIDTTVPIAGYLEKAVAYVSSA